MIDSTSPTPLLTKEGARGRSLHPPSGEQTAGSEDENGTGRFANQQGSGPEGTDPLLAEIRARIEGAIRYPLLAERMKIQGKVQVSFRIDRAGNPADLTVRHASGSEVLDKEALATIQRAGPFPLYEKPLSVWLHYGG